MGFSSLVSFVLALIMWVWPVDGPVVRPFNPPPQPWQPGHRGADLAGAAGDEVKAAGAGVVAFAGLVVDRQVVSIDHAGGLRTTYEPVAPVVRAGEFVVAGDLIGHLLPGHAGCPRVCLHWGLRHGDDYLDPLALVVPVKVRLLPTGTGNHPRSPASPARHRMRRRACRRAVLCRRRASSARGQAERSALHRHCLGEACCRRAPSIHPPAKRPRRAKRPRDADYRRRICMSRKGFRSTPISTRRRLAPPQAGTQAAGAPPRPPRPPAPPGQPPAEPAPRPRRPPDMDLCWRDVPLGWGFAMRGHRFRHRLGKILGGLRASRCRVASLCTLAWQAVVLAGARRRRRPAG